MTSQEIKGEIDSGQYGHDIWLVEIAYQLAVLNERQAEEKPSDIVRKIREHSDRIDNLEAFTGNRDILLRLTEDGICRTCGADCRGTH